MDAWLRSVITIMSRCYGVQLPLEDESEKSEAQFLCTPLSFIIAFADIPAPGWPVDFHSNYHVLVPLSSAAPA